MSDWWSKAPLASAKGTATPADAWWANAPKAEQAAPVDLTTPEDPIRAEVMGEIEQQRANGLERPSGTARQWLQGATFGLADEALAAAMTPVEMVKRGTLDPRTAYAYAKAREDLELETGRRNNGMLGTAAETLGNVGTGVKLAQAGVSAIPAMAARFGGPGVASTAVGSAIDGAIIGGVSGAADGSGVGRFGDAAQGAAIGGALGGALPLAGAAVGTVAAPIISNISARANPESYAQRQIGRALAESRQTPDQVADRIASAAADAQPEYRLIDALDYAGRRLGATVTKNPGEGRTELRQFLNDRQSDQGSRVSNILAEGFDAPLPAVQAAEAMKKARNSAADQAYGQARSDAGAVNVQPALERIDEVLKPGVHGVVNPDNRIANDSVEAALSRARSLLSDGSSQRVNFEAVQRVKGDLDDAIGSAVRSGQNNKARLLGQVTRELDAALEQSSASYAAARNAYRSASREIDAVDTGRVAAGRGRTEPKVAAFGALAPGEQQAFRIGYVDPLIARAQNAAEGVNAVRPLTSLSARTELPAFAAPGAGDQMMRRIGREGEMFATRAEAVGNSKTSENLADDAAAGVDFGLIRKLLGGDVLGAAREGLTRATAGINGNTEPVRAAMAQILQRGDPTEVRGLLQAMAAANAQRSQAGLNFNRGLLSGLVPELERASAPRAQSRR